MNEYEANARFAKVVALADQIEALFVPALETLPPHSRSQMIAACIPTWPMRDWADLSSWAGVNPPSEKTISAVLELFQRRAQRVTGPRPLVLRAVGGGVK